MNMNLDNEIWKIIKEYDNYKISNLGRIKKDNIILYLKTNNYGYFYLYISEDSKQYLIHRLMYETFNDYKLEKNEIIHHIDENKENNNLDNLKLMIKRYHDIFHRSGDKHPKGMLGKFHSDETKSKISEKRKIKFKNGDLNFKGENHPMFGKKHLEKTKRLMRNNHANFKGFNNPASKLTIKNYFQIKKLIKLNFKNKDIANIFGISPSTISQIKNNKYWLKEN